MTTYTIIATAHHVDAGDMPDSHVIPYDGDLSREAVEAAVCQAVIEAYTIEPGDCTDEDEGYVPGLDEIKIDSYVVVRGSVEVVPLTA